METVVFKVSEKGKLNPTWLHIIDRFNKQYFGFDFPVWFNSQINHWWLAIADEKIVGFAGAEPQSKENLFLGPCGVIPEARGHGIQKRFLAIRELYARRKGYVYTVTYAHFENYPSLNSLIGSGYHIHHKKNNKGEFIYFRKRVNL